MDYKPAVFLFILAISSHLTSVSLQLVYSSNFEVFVILRDITFFSQLTFLLGILLLFVHMARFDHHTTFGQRLKRLGRWWLGFLIAVLILVAIISFIAISFSFVSLGLLFTIIALFLLIVEPLRLPAENQLEKQTRLALLSFPVSYIIVIAFSFVMFWTFGGFFFSTTDSIDSFNQRLDIMNALAQLLFVVVYSSPIYILKKLSDLKETGFMTNEEDLELYKQAPQE